MADLKFRTGASASVTKEKSLEEKLAGIIGTSTGNIRRLETDLRAQREAEEARKKAEEEARKRAEAAQAAAASAASAQAAKRAEGERQATIRALKQRLAANLKSPDATVGSAPAAPAAQMVSLGQEEEEARITQARAIKTQAAAGLNKTPDNALREAFGTAEAEQESTVRREPNDLDRMLDAGDKEGLAYAAQRAASQAKVADEALEKNERYLADMREKVETLERQIGAIRSKSRRTDEENEQLQALNREYKLYKPLYDKAQDINKRRTQQDEYAKAWNEAAQTYAYLGDAEGRYSDERGVLLQENARQLEEIWLYGGTPEYISNNYAMLSELAASVGMDLESYVADMQENGKNYVRTAKAEYAAWYQGKIEHDIMVTLFTLPEADEEMFRKIVAFYDTDTTTTDLFGNSAYAKQTDNARSYERTLQAKYGEDYERILDRVTRLVNSERREQQLAAFKSASGLEKAALSVFSVATNFVSSPGVLFEYALQSAQAADRDYYSPIDTNERGFAMQNFTQDVRGITAAALEEKYGSGASFAYSTAMSGIDSFVTGALLGSSGGILLGATAASNTMQDITSRGGTVEQAVIGGIAAGAFEMIFESVSIGSMQAMQKTAFTAASAKDMFSLKTLKTYVGNIAKETGINFTEEAATEIANIMYDIAVLGDVSNYQLRINELMANDPNMTEAQAKKILATELALQVVEAGLSGALMGAAFGAIDTSIAAVNHVGNLRMLEGARTLAATLPAERRPEFDATTVSDQSAAEYALAVYNETKAYNAERMAAEEAEDENAEARQRVVEEKAAVTVDSLATPQQVYDAMQEGRAAAQAESGAQAAETVQQQAAVMPQERETVQDVSAVNRRETAPASFDTDDTTAFAEAEAERILESLDMYEGQTLYEVVTDEANQLRIERRADVADALERKYQEKINGGNTYGDSLSQGSERDAGASAGGEAGTMAESAGSDQSRNVQARLGIDRRTAAENSGAEKVSVRSLGLRNGTTGATVYDITDTTKDPELVNLENDAKLAGAELRFVVGKLTFTNGVTATGIYDNGAIVVTTDDAIFSATQIANHELYHWIHSKTPGVTDRLIERLKQEFSEQELNELIAAYEQLYAGTGATADMILEEICADMYAGMIREQYAAARNANLPQFTGEARRIVRERSNVSALGERDANGTRAGPEETKTAAGSDAGDGRYSFAGVRAKNADREALRQAKQMKEDGANAAEIFRETGWFVGGDGKWRFEIDDSTMSLRQMDVIPTFTRLGELIDAPMLFEAYPDLADMDITFENLDKGINGAYNRQFDDIALSYKLKSDEAALLSALAHEVQHAIQARERFAHGATVEYWERRIREGMDSRTAQQRRDAEQVRREYEEIRENDPEFFEEVSALTASTPTVPRAEINWETLETIGEDPIEWQEFDAKRDALEEKYGSMRVFDFMDLQYKLQQIAAQVGRSATDLYYDTAGEIEARDAARRRTLTAEERRQRMPDTGNEDTVFAEGNGELMRMNEVDLSGVSAATEDESKNLDATDKRNLARYYNDLKAANDGTLASNKMVLVGKPSEILEKYLNSSNPIYIPQKIIKKVAKEKTEGGKHGLGMTVLEELPFQFADPLAITGNTSLHVSLNDKSIVVWTDWKTVNGDSVIVPIRIEANGNVGIYNNVNSVFDAYNEEYVNDLLRDGNILYTRNGKSIQELLTQRRQVPKWENADASEHSISDPTPSVNPRFSISDDTTELMQDSETLTKQLEAVESDIDILETNYGTSPDSATRVQYLELQMKKTAIETELHERTMRAREAAMREGEPERAEKLDELKLIEAHEQELWAEAAAERRAWKEDDDREHLANAENLKEQARAERRKANKLRKELGITKAREYRPADAMQQTGTAILKAFGIPNAQRAQMRQELNTVFERILTHGYVSNNELDSVVRTLYENGKGTVRPVSETHQRIAADLKGKTLYLDLDMRKTYKDQEWNDIRAELYRLGVKTSRVENEGTTRVEDMYELLKTAYPEVFTAEALTPQAKLEAMLEAGQLGTTRRVKLDSTESKAAFDELMKTVKRELATFTKVAGLENRMLEETQRTREYYENLAKEARERRVRSELMTRTRNTVKRLARMAERNDALLNKTLAQLDPDLRKSAENAMQTLDFVANRMTGKTKAGLLALRDSVLEVYNVRDGDEYKAEYEMYVPAEVRAAIPALERLGKVQINDLTLDELQTLVTAVNVITENLDRMNRIISDSWDQQLDNAGRELLKEIEENTDGAKGNSNLAAFWNEKSLSPSRALLRLVGYDRSGVMGHVVEDFEQGDRDVMGYTIGADRIFADFIADAENRKWLKTAAGKNAAFIDVDIPAVLEVGKGDKPILDKDKPGALTVRMQITPMMVVQMARDLQNEQNIRHFEEGGYTFPSIALYKKGNTGAMFVQGERTFRLSRDFVQQIVDQHLGEVGKKYVKLLDQYYNVFSKNHINHTSQLLTGEDKAIADSYNPLRTDAAYRGKTYNVFDGTIEGMGSLKSRQQLASSPIMLDDADATFQWHKESIAKYVGYAVPMRNFKALMNYKPAHQSKTIHAVIGEKFGSNASKFITDFIAFVDAGEIEHVESLKFLEKLTDAYIGNVLSFNISSALKQISALATAGTSYGQGVVTKAMVTFKAVDEELIRIYTPYLDYRGAGYSTVEIANFVRALEDARMSKLAQFVAGKSWLTSTDLWVNRRLWLAAEYVVQNTTQLRPSSDMAIVKSGNDPYYKAVAEVFNRMTHDTQTNYNTMSRPMILRSKNAIVRALTMFKTDAYQIQGIAREAFGAYRTAKRKYNASQTEANEAELRRAKAQLVRSMTGILTSSLMSSILGNFIRLLRNWKEYKDEDGKFSWEKFFEKMPKALFQDTLSNITGAVLLGDQLTDVVYSWIFGDTFWEPEIVSFSTLKDLCDSLDKLGENFGKYISTIRYLRDGGEDWQSYMKNHADAIMGDLRKAMYQIAQALGVPLKNIEKTLLMPFEIFAPELATAYQDFFGDFEKASLANTTGEEREAALHAYLTDEVGDLGETAEAEILRLYELYGNKALPGSDAPTSVKELDENGNEIERKPTLTELGNWDAEYRRKMMDSLGELIGSDFYNSLSDEEKLKLISRANEYARNTAKEYAGMPVNYEKWMENVSSAIDAGTDLASALYFYTKASTLKADKDENGEAISGSLALKELALLESMDTSGAAKLDLLEGVLSPAQLENLDMLLNAGYDVDGAVNMIRTSLETGKSLKSFTKYLEQGFDREAAQELYEAMAALEPEEGKRQVSNAQEYEAILASGLDDAEKWTAFAGMFDADEEKALAKMEAVRAAGGTPDDYAELRQIGQVDAYLRGVENGLSANTSLRIVNAVAALPELPEGESYDTSERQLAAVQACGTPEEQIIAYAMYGTSTSAKTNTAKFTAALAYDVTPEMYLEARALAKASYDADANGSLKQEEVVAALEAMDLTDRQRAALFQLFDSGWKKNPYGNTADIRDAYAAAKEDK